MFMSLAASAFLMGLAGIPHCATMCATPCSLAAPQGLSPGILVGRSLGYACLGATSVLSLQAVGAGSRWATWLQPLWTLVLASVLITALWMTVTGRLPEAMERLGRAAHRWVSARASRHLLPGHAKVGAGRVQAQGWRMAMGMTWAALPCGLLYSAVVVASLAPSMAEGAAVMLAFSLPGMLVLRFLPSRLRRVMGPGTDPRWALRLSGLLLAATTGWGLWLRAHAQWLAWCA